MSASVINVTNLLSSGATLVLGTAIVAFEPGQTVDVAQHASVDSIVNSDDFSNKMSRNWFSIEVNGNPVSSIADIADYLSQAEKSTLPGSAVVLYGTSATPPAGAYPNGTVYVQYTP